MEGNWKVQLLIDLSQGPFAMLDQVAMNKMDKPNVLTIVQKLEQQIAVL